MCVDGCQKAVQAAMSRRGFFRGAGAVTIAAGALVQGSTRAVASPRNFSRVEDLTHVLNSKFPTYGGATDYVELEQLYSIEKNGYKMYRWHITEHVGTHIDAPAHFSADGHSADTIDVNNLVVPLAVIDVRSQAASNSDYQLSPDDIRAWEATNGPLPEGCCVAMNSGWDAHVDTEKFRNADDKGGLHFPGFHPESADLMLNERTVSGIAVDTLSLDYGASADFATHVKWLPSNRWGLECVANLGAVPAVGATMVVGSPKIEGVTGGPSRIIALI